MDNMKIWEKVKKTDPSATKAAKVGGMNITSISGQHMVMKATEVFGPVGIGWGWRVVEERFDKGGEIHDDKRGLIGHEVGHTVRIALWFELDGKRGEVEQYGCTPFTYKSKWGVTTDTEAPKKSLTDAIKKALSMLGFSADIYMGLFDDADYVNQRAEEEYIEKAADHDQAEAEQKQARLDWLAASLKLMDTAVSAHELKMLHAKFVRDADRRKETNFVKRLARAFDENTARIAEKEKAA